MHRCSHSFLSIRSLNYLAIEWWERLGVKAPSEDDIEKMERLIADTLQCFLQPVSITRSCIN